MHPDEAHKVMDEMMGGGMMYSNNLNDEYNTNYGGSNMMDGYGYSNLFGFGLFEMGFIMILFWGLVIWFIYFVIKSTTGNQNNSKHKVEDSLDIAKKRFAKGEITKKEFEEIKKELK
ncbi:MAG: SHOCT domain-containing protein [Candidatus Woesearchaeota archaeon]|jgi:putative membrane protein|nr:SHOCT domain-containing protein [Candidatus Woesearchaeota archaeon]